MKPIETLPYVSNGSRFLWQRDPYGFNEVDTLRARAGWEYGTSGIEIVKGGHDAEIKKAVT